MGETYTLRLPLALRPLLSNAARRMHYHAKSNVCAEYRDIAGWRARAAKVPALDPLGVVVEFRAVYKRGPLPDPHAIDPTAKAMLDGLVDAGVFPDDSQVEITYRRPRVDKTWQGIEVSIIEVAS